MLHTITNAWHQAVALIDRVPSHVWLAAYALWIAACVVFILGQRRNPQATLAWLIAFVTFPGLSAVAYFIFGPRRLRRRRIRRLLARRLMNRVVSQRVTELHDPQSRASVLQARYLSLAHAATVLGEPMARRARSVHVLQDGKDTYAAIEQGFASARRHIHLEYYIFEPDEIGTRWRDLLAARARDGIKVRMLVDALGSYRCRSAFWKPLLDAGGEVRQFNRPRMLRMRPGLFNFRTHRKIVVIDGEHAFTGGINVSAGSYLSGSSKGHWRDTHVAISGQPVMDLQMLFLEDWLASGEERDLRRELREAGEQVQPPPLRDTLNDGVRRGIRHGVGRPRRTGAETAPPIAAAIDDWFPPLPADDGPWCQVIASGPDSPAGSATHRMYFDAITTATSRVWISTPYFIPDEPLMTALVAAAARGVDVQVIVPQQGDSRLVTAAAETFAEDAARSGIHVHRYQPRMLHAKTMVVDDMLGVIGTANLDNRSFRLNFEVIVVFYDNGLNAELARTFEADLRDTTPQDRGVTGSFVPRLLDSAARLCAPLL